MKFLKNLIALIRRNKYKELAERIQNLESRIFKKKELTPEIEAKLKTVIADFKKMQ